MREFGTRVATTRVPKRKSLFDVFSKKEYLPYLAPENTVDVLTVAVQPPPSVSVVGIEIVVVPIEENALITVVLKSNVTGCAGMVPFVE
jgi:hypothetical protein